MKIPTFSIGSTSSNGGLLSNCLIFLPLKNSSRDKKSHGTSAVARKSGFDQRTKILPPTGTSWRINETKKQKGGSVGTATKMVGNIYSHHYGSMRRMSGIFTYMDVSLKKAAKWHILTIGSMYGIFRYLHENHKNQPNLGIWIYHTWKR